MKRAARSVVLAILAASLLWQLGRHMQPGFPVDDAYITFRYSRNLVEGQGLVFNAGDHVEGYSNFLWVVLVGGLQGLGVDPPLGARLLGLGSLLAILIAMGRILGRRHLPAAAVWLSLGLILTFSPITIFNVLSGLETPLFAALLLWAVALMTEAGGGLVSRARTWAFAACLGALALTRPEGAPIGCVLAAAELSGALFYRRDREEARRLFWAVLAVFVAPFVLYLGWRMAYYGLPLPNSVYAKQGMPGAEKWQRAWAYVRGFFQGTWTLWPLALLAVLDGRRTRIQAAALAAATLLGLALVTSSGDPYPYWRYLYPLLPLLLVLGGSGLLAAGERLAGAPRSARSAALGGFAAVAAVLALVYLGRAAWEPRLPRVDPAQGLARYFSQDKLPHLPGPQEPLRNPAELHLLAKLLQERALPGDLLATSEVGIAPYYSRIRVVDTFGLVDRHVASLPGPPGGKPINDYLFGLAPRFIAFKVESLEGGAVPADWALFEDVRLAEQYELLRIIYNGWNRLLVFERKLATPGRQLVADLTRSFGTAAVRFRAPDGSWTQLPELAGQLVRAGGSACLPSDGYEDARRALAEAESDPHSSPPPGVMGRWLGRCRPFIYQNPGSGPSHPELHYPLRLSEGAVLSFGLAQAAEFWDSRHGDGVRYRVEVRPASGEPVTVFTRWVDAKNDPRDRRWIDAEVDLSAWGGQEVVLVLATDPGPQGDAREDHGGWGQPMVWASPQPKGSPSSLESAR